MRNPVPYPTIYVINLEGDTARLASITDSLAAIGLNFERVPAIRGKDVPGWESMVDVELYARRNNKPMATPGEVGCTLSHLKAMETFLSTQAPWCVIMEDDVAANRELPDVLSALAKASGEWDLVKLFCFHSGTPVTVRRLTHDRRLVIHLTRTTSTAAYAVNRRAAEVLIRILRPISEQIDHAIDRPWESGLRIRGVRPLAVGLAPIAYETTIGHRPAKPLLARRSGSLIWHRAVKEIRRLLQAIGEVIRTRLRTATDKGA